MIPGSADINPVNAPEPPPDSVSPRPSVERLRLWEKLGLSAFAVALVAFGGLVLLRSAFQESRKTDAGVYFRAADAVLKGKDLYALTVCDDNGWHYCYPPAFATRR